MVFPGKENRTRVRPVCAELGYGDPKNLNNPNVNIPKYTKLSRHTKSFYNLFEGLNEEDLRSEVGEDTLEMCERFLEAECHCSFLKSSHVHRQTHGNMLWPASGEIHVRGMPLVYPEHKEVITTHVKRLLVIQHENTMRVKEEKQEKGGGRKRRVARKARSDIDDYESDEQREFSLPSQRFHSAGVGQAHVASHQHRPSMSLQRRTRSKDPIEIYLSSLYPPKGNHDNSYTPGNSAEAESLNLDSSSLLSGDQDVKWLEKNSLFMERQLHENNLYFVEHVNDSARLGGLVAKLKERLKLTCGEVHNKIIAQKCKRFIMNRTNEWIDNGCYLERVGKYPGPLEIRQCEDFSKKLCSFREKWERTQRDRSLAASEAIAETHSSKETSVPQEGQGQRRISSFDDKASVKRQRTGESSMSRRELNIYDDSDSDVQEIGWGKVPNSSLPLTPKSTTQSHFGLPRDKQNEYRSRGVLCGRQRSMSPKTVQPASLELSTVNHFSEYSSNIVGTTSANKSTRPAPSQFIPATTFSHRAPPSQIEPHYPLNEIVLKQLRPEIQYNSPHDSSVLRGSVNDFFTLYSEESQISSEDFEQLEFSFPDASIKTKHRVKNNEMSWKSLNVKIEKLRREAIEENVRKGNEFIVFEIRVEAVPLPLEGNAGNKWSWDAAEELGYGHR